MRAVDPLCMGSFSLLMLGKSMVPDNELTLFGQKGALVNALVVESEEDAWKLLTKLQNPNFAAPDDVIFKNWNNFELHLKGQQWNSSITPSLFPLFNNIQSLVYQSYAKAKYGDKKKRLTNEEREKLEIVIRVTQGSSKPKIKIDLQALALACVGKMSSKDILIAVLVITLGITSQAMYADYLQSVKDARLTELHNEDKKALLDHMEFASKEETKRAKLLADAASKNEITSDLIEEVEDIHQSMLKSATKATTTTANSVSITQPIAEELIKSKRQKPEPTQINGLFRISNIDWNDPNQITLARLEDGIIIRAVFDLKWLSEDAKNIIKNTEWKTQGDKVFRANINARIGSNGQIVNAELVRVESADSAGPTKPEKNAKK